MPVRGILSLIEYFKDVFRYQSGKPLRKSIPELILP